MKKFSHKTKKGFAKKSLGQNFLESTQVRDQILAAAGDLRDQRVLEIGPGLGFLTTKLLKAGADLTVVELDPRAAEVISRDFGHMDRFDLVQDDVLQVDIDALMGDHPYRIIANIPYNITSPILRKFLSSIKNKPTSMILMVQKEVAEKIVDPKKTSILSLSVEIYATARQVCAVGRECFRPVPRVDSAVIEITLRDSPLVLADLEADFFTLLHAGFGERRKKLSNALGKFFGMPAGPLLGDIDGDRRAETLSVEEWLVLVENFRSLGI